MKIQMKKILSSFTAATLLSVSFTFAVSADLPAPSEPERQMSPPDILTMQDGTKVTSAQQWAERRDEIRAMLEYYMYGPWRGSEDETLSFAANGDKLDISVEYGGETANFEVSVLKPDGTAPDGGWPVFVVFGGIGEVQSYALSKGYAIITLNPNDLASDNTERKGEFYKLYPYGSTWQEQSGVLMGWSWGASKVLDALEQGAGDLLDINPDISIVTGISRYGKAAAVAGAFDVRFTVTMPVCSGYGGLTMGRYKSNNLTYSLLPDFENDPKISSVGDLSAWKSTGGTEGIQGLQGSGWFNEIYKGFTSYSHTPFDQHFLSALCAMEGRYLFMVSGINSDMWNSPPGLWYNYEEVRPAFELLGLEDNLAIQFHLNLHGVEIEDLVKLIAYTDFHLFGKNFDTSEFPAPWDGILADFSLDDLKTSVFASEANAEAYAAGKPDPNTLDAEAHPETNVPVKIRLGDSEIEVTVKRNENGDALISEAADGNGFKFKYGPNLQYSQTYAQFELRLPPGLQISDFESVAFTCKTNANYWGKKMAVIAAPKSTGLPPEFEYDYNSGKITPDTVTALSTNNMLPPFTMDATPLVMEIDKTAAEALEGSEFQCSIYIHMEHLDGDAEYIISDIVFNPRDGITVDIPEGFYDAAETTEVIDTTEAAASETTAEQTNAGENDAVETQNTADGKGGTALIIIGFSTGAVLIIAAVLIIKRKK